VFVCVCLAEKPWSGAVRCGRREAAVGGIRLFRPGIPWFRICSR